jgi:uncharacterized membrane protein YhdT
MTTQVSKNALRALYWSLGLVVLLQSCLLAFAPAGKRAFGHIGLPDWIRMVLAGSEILAAVLFLIPRAMVVGGYLLLAIFGVAMLIHVLHGQWEVGGLVIYAMAVLVILSERNDRERIAK